MLLDQVYHNETDDMSPRGASTGATVQRARTLIFAAIPAAPYFQRAHSALSKIEPFKFSDQGFVFLALGTHPIHPSRQVSVCLTQR